MWPNEDSWLIRFSFFAFIQLHPVDCKSTGVSIDVSPRSTGVNCHLQTHHATGGKPRRTEPPKANRCPNLWQAPASASPPPLASPPPQTCSSECRLRSPAPVAPPGFGRRKCWGTAGVPVVPPFEGCPNEKQTNKSGEFRVSFKRHRNAAAKWCRRSKEPFK